MHGTSLYIVNGIVSNTFILSVVLALYYWCAQANNNFGSLKAVLFA